MEKRNSVDLVVIVPARGGSKRLPGKNLMRLGGKSLLTRVDDAIMEAKIDAPVILTTDDELIAEEGRRLGWAVPFLRPRGLATDTASTTDAITHLLDWRRKQGEADPEMIMVLQPTSPLRRGSSLSTAVALLRANPDVDSVIGMRAIERPAFGVFVADENGVAVSISPWDRRMPIYISNGALFLTRTEAFRRQQSLYAGRIMPLVMDDIQSIDIDTEADFRIAAALLTVDIDPQSVQAAPSRAS